MQLSDNPQSWAGERKGKLQLVRKDGETRLIGIPRQEDLPILLAKIRETSVVRNENKDL